jgi:hypothetical protein
MFNGEEEDEEQDDQLDDDMVANQMMDDVDRGDYSDSEDGDSPPIQKAKKDPKLVMIKA